MISNNALTPNQVRHLDQKAIYDLGIPGLVLMDRASMAVAEVVIEYMTTEHRQSALFICGKGNNGGDGFAGAAHVVSWGYDAKAILLGEATDVLMNADDAGRYLEIASNLGIELFEARNAEAAKVAAEKIVEHDGPVVDALFGTGFSGKLRPPADRIVEAINQARGPVIAVDIPSGLNGETGSAEGLAVKADVTVTFAALKSGFLSDVARSYTGKIRLVDIGIPVQAFESTIRIKS